MTELLFVLLVLASACALRLLWLVVRGRNKRLLISEARGIACDASNNIGISLLCSGVNSLEQVENLLSTEYSRCEVIVVLDARRRPLEFDALASRYRMIRVEWNPSGELDVHGVRALGRSRKRYYRRLVLIDRAEDTPQGDYDAALAIATYDYVMPVREDQYLLPDTISRLVAEVSEHSDTSPALVRSWIGSPARLFSRETVVAAGGFGNGPARKIARRQRRVLWEPLLRSGSPSRTPRAVRIAVAVVLMAGIVAAAAAGWWPATALLLAVALVWSAAQCAVLAVADVAGPGFGSLTVWSGRRRN